MLNKKLQELKEQNNKVEELKAENKELKYEMYQLKRGQLKCDVKLFKLYNEEDLKIDPCWAGACTDKVELDYDTDVVQVK